MCDQVCFDSAIISSLKLYSRAMLSIACYSGVALGCNPPLLRHRPVKHHWESTIVATNSGWKAAQSHYRIGLMAAIAILGESS